MKRQNILFTLLLLFALSIGTLTASAGDKSVSTVGAGGYDVVSYHTGNPQPGTGFNKSVHDGVTYVFISEENKDTFEKNPHKYLPAYGGYCAYGVAVGQKFVASPEVWKIEDGVLYFNLDKNIQAKWEEDLNGHINKADKNWKQIKNTSAEELAKNG